MKFLIVFCLIAWFGQGLWIILLAAYFADKTTKRLRGQYKVELEAINNKNRWP